MGVYRYRTDVYAKDLSHPNAPWVKMPELPDARMWHGCVAAEVDGDCCNFYKSKADDRKLHRAGLCVVNIGSVFENCPKLQKFMGIDLTSIKDKRSKDELTFSKWNFRMKRLFYDHYTQQGGTKEFKQWSKSRWFNKKPIIPEKTGRARIANDLHGLLFL